MAYKILHEAMHNPSQENFVAFVGREHLLEVACHLTHFLNQPKEFMAYQAPPQILDQPEIRESPVIRAEMAKTFALFNTIYEDEQLGTDLPFVHNVEEDVATLLAEERKIQKDLTLVSSFEDMKGLGVELDSDALIPEKQIKQHLEQHGTDDKAALEEFMNSERGGGGIAKCFPVSYL